MARGAVASPEAFPFVSTRQRFPYRTSTYADSFTTLVNVRVGTIATNREIS
jgi:hypothetical protein